MGDIVQSTLEAPHILMLLYMISPIVFASVSLIVFSLAFKYYSEFNSFVRIGFLAAILNSVLIFLLMAVLKIEYDIIGGIISSILIASTISSICLCLGTLLAYNKIRKLEEA